jgi:hypothetical protein
MTAALVRNCNACKKPFYKEEGCNQMTCPCGNKQCFVCSIDVQGYDHFDRTDDNSGPQDCPMFDNTRERLRQEVAAAQIHAVQEAMQERTDLTEADLTVDPNLAGGNNLPGGNQVVPRNEENVLERVRVRREQITRERHERERQAEIDRLGAEQYRQQRQERIRERRRLERERQAVLRQEAEDREQERLNRERVEMERLEVERLEQEMRQIERMERERLEAQLREDQEALEAVQHFEMRQRLEEERLLQQVIRETAEEERWNAIMLKRTAYVGEDEIQNLPPYEIEGYCAGRSRHLQSFITDLKGLLTHWEHMRSQGIMSETCARRYEVGKRLVDESMRELDRFATEAKVRRKHYERAEKRRRKDAAEALKLRVKEREQERKGMEAAGGKVRRKKSILFWKKS